MNDEEDQEWKWRKAVIEDLKMLRSLQKRDATVIIFILINLILMQIAFFRLSR